MVLFFIFSTITPFAFGGGLFVYGGHWAFLGKTLRHIFAYVATLLDHFPTPAPYCFPHVGKIILATVKESRDLSRHLEQHPLHRWEDWVQKHEPKCLWCSSSSVAEPGLDSVFTLDEWFLYHVTVLFLSPSPYNSQCFLVPTPTPAVSSPFQPELVAWLAE